MPDALRSVRLLRILRHGPGLFSLRLPKTWEGSARPGSFVLASLAGLGERPISISSEETEDFELTVRVAGPFTAGLSHLEAGAWVGLRGPFGRGFTMEGHGRRRILVAGGIGLAPIRFLAQRLIEAGAKPVVLLGARSAADLCFVEDFVAAGARLATEDGSLGARGLVTALLAEELARPEPAFVQACGPEAMLVAVRRAALAAGAAHELSLERIMKCGLGICGHCCASGSGIRLCREGPVLGSADLDGIGGFELDAMGLPTPG
jgi:dihydroorotate dehydrogenase electron transfer subunit